MALQELGSEVPASDLPDSNTDVGAPVPADDMPVQASSVGSEVPASDLPTDYSTPGQQLLTGIEGAGQGYAGPLATAAELGLSKLGVPGLSPEEQAGRAAAHPWIHGGAEALGLGAGIITGTGEAGLVGKIGEAATQSGNFSKLGASVIKGAIESGLFQTGDEISNAILGKSDPEAPVAAALTYIGAAGLIGGGIGGTIGGVYNKFIKAVEDSDVVPKTANFLEDFGNRYKFNQDNPSMVDAVTSDLRNYYGSTMSAADDVYGPAGIKAQAIEKLVPEMSDKITQQNNDIYNTLQNKISEMMKNPDYYPARLTQKLIQHANEWATVATDGSASSNQIFNATQDLKQTLQAYSKFDKVVGPLSPEKDFIGVAKELQNGLRLNLEDQSVWGDAAKLQKNINNAFFEFKPKLQEFQKRMMTKVEGEPVIDPGKINTYVNQLGKPSAEIKQGVMGDFINAAQKYRDKINDIHSTLGVDSPIPPASINSVLETLKEKPTPGARFADYIFNKNGELADYSCPCRFARSWSVHRWWNGRYLGSSIG